MITLKSRGLKFVNLIVIIILCTSCSFSAQEQFDIKANYSKAEYMIAMRDGVNLFTQVYTPKDTTQNYPFLLFRTPYSVRNYGVDNYRNYLGPNRIYAKK